MTTTFTEDAISEITRMVWAAIIDPSDELVERAGEAPRRELTGMVEISGTWTGSVCLGFSRRAARQAAAAMFGADADALDDDEVADAVGELVNVVGGNLKGLLPPPAQLSLPSVREGDPTTVGTGRAELVSELQFDWCDEPLSVVIWRADDAAGD
ncbi:MAG TPA: chemotaxis protein CheX [Acidimicrobiales bacterium]|nr:chemotaxis protein CheX [Acidimicrobiales bacterium]